MNLQTNQPVSERALLIRVHLTGRPASVAARASAEEAEESLGELAVLAESAGACVVEKVLQTRPAYDQTTLVGSGKLEELKSVVKALDINLVLFDHELGGTQQRNLEKHFEVKVIDRTQLILDIFARRARTREGQLQVELAQLRYLLPRLTGRGAAMSRLGGGIGTRGPGETKLETDRRRIHHRIKKIERDLTAVRGSRGVQRRLRQAVPLMTLALVGYTNAGKSTLFNRLTGSGVLADARMFATLDPTVRQVVLPSRRKVLLSDTVGFIRNLPTTLVEAFRATLEEVVESRLLIHVVDASSSAAAEHCAHVREVLAEIGAEKTPQILVLNKSDTLPADSAYRDALARRLSGESGGCPAVWVSARTGKHVEALLALIDSNLPDDAVVDARFRLPLSEFAALNLLHSGARVLEEQFTEEGCEIRAEVPESILRRLAAFRTS